MTSTRCDDQPFGIGGVDVVRARAAQVAAGETDHFYRVQHDVGGRRGGQSPPVAAGKEDHADAAAEQAGKVGVVEEATISGPVGFNCKTSRSMAMGSRPIGSISGMPL